MKKNILLFLLLPFFSYAQQGQWTWMAGSQTPFITVSYGTMGVPSPTNSPGFRYESARWTDLQGNLWLYGGQHSGTRSDMWKFDITLNEWIWMNGPNTGYPVATYTNQGIFSPTNHPAAVYFGSVEFTDNAGNFWLYEGDGFQNLWKYDVSINQWAWMHGPGTTGNQIGVYGPQGVFSPTNLPAGVSEHHGGWCDTSGILWLYGGATAFPQGCSDVLWKYDPQINQWAWVSGNPTNGSVPPVYGVQNVSAATNTPGSRNIYATWLSENNELYLYGNGGFCGGGVERYDVWKYSIALGEWTWVSGITTNTQRTDSVGSICESSTAFYPVRGTEMHTNAQRNNCNRFYYYGNDLSLTAKPTLWSFNANTNEWTMLTYNSSGQPNYGTFQTPGPNVHPGEHFGSVGWCDNDNNYWLYGNQDPDYTGAIWRYSPIRTVTSLLADTLSCLNTDTVQFGTVSTLFCGGVDNWIWNFGDPASGTADTSTLVTPVHIFSSPGTYTVTLITTNCDRSDTSRQIILIDSIPSFNLGPDTSICVGQSITLASSLAGTYLWNTGDTSISITIDSAGVYSLEVHYTQQCSVSDTVVINSLPLPQPNLGADTSVCTGSSILLYPGAFTSYLWNTGDTTSSIQVNADGTYSVQVIFNGCINSDTLLLGVDEWPVADINADSLICSLILDAGNPGTNYLWNTGDTSQTITIDRTGVYWVTITNGTCSLTDSIAVSGELGISALYIPNAFTPNDDGKNDRFIPIGENITDFHMLIFNRWGERIFETEDMQSGWDGRRGNKVQEDVYVYVISYTSKCSNIKQVKRIGHVSVMR